MSEAREAHDAGAPPPSSIGGEDILKQASGGRLLLRMGIAVIAIAVLGAGGWFARKYLRARSARNVATVALPSATVVIGNNQRGQETHEGLAERPAHAVEVHAFKIDVTEVTVEMYRVCMDDGACTSPAKAVRCNHTFPDREQHPVNCVSYNQAEAYCRWAHKRLPSEVEWEYAAGGASPKRLFPWGNTLPVLGDANVCGGECTSGAPPPPDITLGTICGNDGICRPRLFDFDDGFPETAPVGSFVHGNTPEGLMDMAGNVWEWTSSIPCAYPAHTCADTGERVIRGSGWTHRYLMSPEVTTREKLAVSSPSDGVGFRCAL